MNEIQLLDCTLRDGGYVNDWNFGQKKIECAIKNLGEAGIDIIEVGFLKDEPYHPDRTVFSSVHQIENILKQQPTVHGKYAAMIEVTNPIAIEHLQEYKGGELEIIRIIIWKRLLKEGYEYCRQVAAKGYQVCIQPARVDQYSAEEFIDMIKLFSQLDPMALYVVDSFGTQDEESIFEYCSLAHETLPSTCALGYHGHNNLGQAIGTAKRLMKHHWDRRLIIDGSVYGIGRGAGNLQIELIIKWLNENFKTNYRQSPLLQVYDECIWDIYEKHPWGYSIPYYLTAFYGCNPGYADYFSDIYGLSGEEIADIFEKMDRESRIIFSKETAEKYVGNGGSHE